MDRRENQGRLHHPSLMGGSQPPFASPFSPHTLGGFGSLNHGARVLPVGSAVARDRSPSGMELQTFRSSGRHSPLPLGAEGAYSSPAGATARPLGGHYSTISHPSPRSSDGFPSPARSREDFRSRSVSRPAHGDSSDAGSFMYSVHPLDALEAVDDSSSDESSVSRRAVIATVDSGVHSATSSNILHGRPPTVQRLMSSASFVEDDEAPLVFVKEPSPTLVCLFCKTVYRDAIIAACAHTYCRRCVEKRHNEKCPVDGQILQVLVPNITVQQQVMELSVCCRHGVKPSGSGSGWERDPAGCPALVRINDRREHEDSCDFAQVPCPNSRECPQVLKKDLEHHLKVCTNCRCPNHRFGCAVAGTRSDLEQHGSSCPFGTVSSYLQVLEEKVSDLGYKVKQREEQVEFLHTMLGTLSERVENMEHSLEIKMETMQRNMMMEVMEKMAALKANILTLTGGPQWDPWQSFKCRGTFVGHQGPLWCLCVDNELLFSGSSDKTIKVWDLSSNYRCLKTLDGHQGIVLALCVVGRKLYSGSQDNNIVLWDIEKFTEEKKVVAHDNPVCTLASTRDMLFSGSLKLIKVWKADTLDLVREIRGLFHWVRALVATDTHLYSGSHKSIKMWDLDTFEVVKTLDTGAGSIYSIFITQHHILCGTNENAIHVWETEAGSEEGGKALVGHTGTVYALAAVNTASGIKVFSAAFDRSIRVWSMENMICTQTLIRHQGSVTSLAISRGRIFSGSVDMTIKVWQS